MSNKDDRERLRELYPDMTEYVRTITQDWPPLSNEAIALCRKARAIHLAKLANRTLETK